MAKAIEYAIKADVDVILISVESVAQAPSRILVIAIGSAHHQGIIVAASAGNSNEDVVRHYPSNTAGVVAAVNQELSEVPVSNAVAS